MTDALDKLIVDESKCLDKEMLASLVQPFLKFTDVGDLIFERKFHELKDWQKVLIYLLGRKVIAAKELKKGFREEEGPNEIGKIIRVPVNSVTKYVSRELKDIIKVDKKKYSVPNFYLYKCEELLKKRK